MQNLVLKEAIVPSEHHGQRVDVMLSQVFPDYSRSQLQQWLKEGAITLNDRILKAKEKVLGGEHVKLNVILEAANTSLEAEDIPLELIFEDEYLLVINKPAGLVVHPGAGNQAHTLVNALLHHAPTLTHLPRAGIIHRLDKETTGLLIIAKTLEAHTQLIRQMQAREINRHYLCLVYGHVISGGTVDTYFGRHPRNRLKMAVTTQGRQAITQYSVNQHFPHFSLLDVTLMTGRTHQIRVHMAHIKHPVVGDPLYGGRARYPAGISDALRDGIQGFKRQALHAKTLSFTHPITEKRLTFSAPLPDDFKFLLSILESESA